MNNGVFIAMLLVLAALSFGIYKALPAAVDQHLNELERPVVFVAERR